MMHLILLVLCLQLVAGSTQERTQTGEERLIKDILRDYGRLARPAVNESVTVKVSLSLNFVRIADYDIVNNVVKANAWLLMSWQDFRLKWDTEEYGVTTLRLPHNYVWVPDIMLYNGAKPEMETASTKVVVSSDGQVIWVPPILLEIPCTLDHGGAKVLCVAKMGSWTYDGFKVDLVDPTFDTTSYIVNPLYSLKETSAQRQVKYYPCCAEPYIDVTFSFDLGFNDPRDLQVQDEASKESSESKEFEQNEIELIPT